MNWTCTSEPIWKLLGNPLISRWMTMMTHIDPPGGESLPPPGPAAVWDIVMRLSSPGPAEDWPGSTSRWGFQSSTSALEAPRWRQVLDGGRKKKKPLSPRILKRQFTESVYFFQRRCFIFVSMQREVSNSAAMQLWQQFFLVYQTLAVVPE